MVYPRFYAFIVTFLLSIMYGWAQDYSDVDSVIVDNLIEERFFEAEELYEQNHHLLSPVNKISSEAKLLAAFRKFDQSNSKIKLLLEEYGENIDKNLKIELYKTLFFNIFESLNYEDYVWADKHFSDYIDQNPDNMTEDEVARCIADQDFVIRVLKKRIASLDMRIERTNTKEECLLKSDSELIIESDINGSSFNSLIDTGVQEYVLISSKTAKEIGLEYSNETMEINGEAKNVGSGILDSLRIGNLKIYNIPVSVIDFSLTNNLPDSLLQNKKFMGFLEKEKDRLRRPIIGLPLLLKIGKIQFDFTTNKVSFPERIESTEKFSFSKPNMFYSQGKIHVKSDLNNILTTLTVDTGAGGSFVDLSNAFYQKHKENLPIREKRIDTKKTINLTLHFHSVEPKTHYRYLKPPIFLVIPPKRTSVRINEDQFVEIGDATDYLTSKFARYDGVLGYSFIKDWGKVVLFDFDNMIFSTVE